jgi:choline-glycine betaine transporter
MSSTDSDNLKANNLKVADAKNEEDEIDFSKYPMREVSYQPSFFQSPLCFNPLVSSIGIILLWGLAFWSMIDPEGSNATLIGWRGEVALYFTWLFIGMKCMFFFFLVYVAIRYHNVKLGGKDEKPEFKTFEYFASTLTTATAIVLLSFCGFTFMVYP